MSTIAAAVILIGVAGVVFVVMNKKKTQNPSPEAPNASAPAPSGPAPDSDEAVYTDIMNTLVRLNLMVRKDPLLSRELTQEIETVIDDLSAITPAMMDRYPGEALTYEIKKIGREHLFKTVKEYLDLSPESREKQAQIFSGTISSLKEVSARSRDIVEKNETAEFKTMANFLAGKFS